MLCPRARLSVSGVGGGHTSRGSPISPSPSLTLYIGNGWASSSSSMWGGTNVKALRSPGESGYHAKESTRRGGVFRCSTGLQAGRVGFGGCGGALLGGGGGLRPYGRALASHDAQNLGPVLEGDFLLVIRGDENSLLLCGRLPVLVEDRPHVLGLQLLDAVLLLEVEVVAHPHVLVGGPHDLERAAGEPAALRRHRLQELHRPHGRHVQARAVGVELAGLFRGGDLAVVEDGEGPDEARIVACRTNRARALGRSLQAHEVVAPLAVEEQVMLTVTDEIEEPRLGEESVHERDSCGLPGLEPEAPHAGPRLLTFLLLGLRLLQSLLRSVAGVQPRDSHDDLLDRALLG